MRARPFTGKERRVFLARLPQGTVLECTEDTHDPANVGRLAGVEWTPIESDKYLKVKHLDTARTEVLLPQHLKEILHLTPDEIRYRFYRTHTTAWRVVERPSNYRVRQLGTGWQRVWLDCSPQQAFARAISENEQINALAADPAGFDAYWVGQRYVAYHVDEPDQPVFRIEPISD